MKLTLDNAIAPIFVFIWSTGFVIARLAMPYVEPATFLFWRFAGVLAAMAALSLVWRITCLAGLKSSISPLLASCSSLVTYLVYGLQSDFTHIPLASYALAFGALLSITFGALYQKKFCPVFDLRAGSFIQFGVSAVLCFICMYLFESGEMVWNPSVIGALLWAIFPLSIGSIGLLFMMSRKGAATKVTSFLYLVPPTTAAMAWMLFDEPFTLLMAVGLCLTMTGVVLVNARQANTVATIAE